MTDGFVKFERAAFLRVRLEGDVLDPLVDVDTRLRFLAPVTGDANAD